jgi:hypothetical protein
MIASVTGSVSFYERIGMLRTPGDHASGIALSLTIVSTS